MIFEAPYDFVQRLQIRVKTVPICQKFAVSVRTLIIQKNLQQQCIKLTKNRFLSSLYILLVDYIF